MMLKDILNNQFVIPSTVDLEDENYDLNRLIQFTKNQNYERFYHVLDHLKERDLYHSKAGNLIHGPNHIERVLFYANVLANFYQISDEDYKILMDGASYHDSGRMGDLEDNCHGMYSAGMIENKILKNDSFYKVQENMNILKAIVDFHSCDDDRLDILLKNYNILEENQERAKRLAYLLKDADALDRVRFIKSDRAYLNVDCLRTEEAKKMVNSAKELVGIYINPVINDYVNINEVEEKTEEILDLHAHDDINIKGCLHGIGWDFFKLDSILVHGILSPFNCRFNKTIYSSPNFLEKNEDFICVIPDDRIKTGKNSAFRNFTDNGISFYALVPKIIEGTTSNSPGAILLHIPYKSGEYLDEAFVEDEIKVDSLEYILINGKNMDVTLDQLDYLNCNITPEVIMNKASYYIDSLREKLGYEVNPQEINLLTGIYNDIFIANKITGGGTNSLHAKAICQKNIINQLIGKYMQDAYSHVLGEEATVGKVVEHIVGKRRENYKITKSEEVMIKIK